MEIKQNSAAKTYLCKYLNVYKLNKNFFNGTQVKEVSREIKNIFILNENENAAYQNFRYIIKSVQQKCVALNARITGEERSEINNLLFHLQVQ